VTRKVLFSLIGVFIISLVLRLFNLNLIPFSLHTDELFAGYVGKYLLLHGQDIYGNVLPLYINKFGDFRPVGVFLLSGLSVLIFGANEFAIRFPIALIGALTIFPIFFVAKNLFNSDRIGVVSALVFAILPWHIILSRTTSEAVIGIFIFLFATYFMLLFAKLGKLKFLILAILLGLTTYIFYHSFRIILPLLFLPLFLMVEKTNLKKLAIISFVIVAAVTFLAITTKEGSGRLNQVVFYKNTIPLNTIEFLNVGEGNNNVLLARIFHNKPIIYGRYFVNQYLSYFSPDFLFGNKGLPTRYALPEQGPLYFTFAPLLILALLFYFKFPNKSKNTWLVFYLLAISILPAAVTYEDTPNLSRSAVMIVPLVILISLGLVSFYENIKNMKLQKIFLALFSVVLLLEFIYFWHMYSVHEKTYFPFYRNEANKSLINYVALNKNKYTEIYIPSTDDLPVYFLFYTNNFNKLNRDDIKKMESGGKYYGINFISNFCLNSVIDKNKLTGLKNSLVIVNGQCDDLGFPRKAELNRQDGTTAFKIFEF